MGIFERLKQNTYDELEIISTRGIDSRNIDSALKLLSIYETLEGMTNNAKGDFRTLNNTSDKIYHSEHIIALNEPNTLPSDMLEKTKKEYCVAKRNGMDKMSRMQLLRTYLAHVKMDMQEFTKGMSAEEKTVYKDELQNFLITL